MKTCPFCISAVPDAAIKCQFCGEFFEKPRKSLLANAVGLVGAVAGFIRSFGVVVSIIGVGTLAVFYKYSYTEVSDISLTTDDWYVAYENRGNAPARIGQITLKVMSPTATETAAPSRSYTPFGELKAASVLFVPPGDPKVLEITLSEAQADRVRNGSICALSVEIIDYAELTFWPGKRQTPKVFAFSRPCPGSGVPLATE